MGRGAEFPSNPDPLINNRGGIIMPAQRKKERVVGRYFVWLIGKRNGVYYADGRSNKINAGRHSLGVTDYDEALDAVQKLDLARAVALNLADPSLLAQGPSQLSLEEGRQLYEEHVRRPRLVGGVKHSSCKRYRAVLDKFLPFAQKEGVIAWNQVGKKLLEKYAGFLDSQNYAYATQYLELTTLKQIVGFLIEAKRLPASHKIDLPMAKAQGTSTYCWRKKEVTAMVDHCASTPGLGWLKVIIIALACTGLRISELASLRWSDIDRKNTLIRLIDETTKPQRRSQKKRRETKSGRDRTLTIHDELAKVLDALKPTADGYVFHGPLGGRLKPDTLRNNLVREVLTPLAARFPANDDDIGFADGRLHSFRHYFCSTCANEGVPEQVVMAWLGHRDSKMVKHYYHLYQEEAQRHMKRLDFIGNPGHSNERSRKDE
jgi:integrase